MLTKDGVAYRATFVVDPEGVIRHVTVNDLSVGRNVDETLRVLDALRDALPEPARDTKLNLQAVLQSGAPGALTPAQRWGVAVATAAAARHRPLLDALLQDAAAELEPAVLDDALAAASLMAMNNVYYRFRHMVGKPNYSEKPARLRVT